MTTEQKHTPEPWHFDDGPPGVVVWATRSGDDDKHVLGLMRWGPIDERVANAARIVACVNACKGISNEELARVTDLAGLVNHYETMKAERDEALALLRDAEERLANYEG